MGVYEIITGITENEENLKVEIRQTEGTLERNLVYISIKEIDSTKNMTDRQIDKAISEARKTLKIVIDTDKLKKQIRASINKKAYKDDDSHIDMKNTTDSELDAIEICFREKED